MLQGSPVTHSYRAEVSSNPSLEVRERHNKVGSLIPWRGALGAAQPLQTHRHQAPPHQLQQHLHPPPLGWPALAYTAWKEAQGSGSGLSAFNQRYGCYSTGSSTGQSIQRPQHTLCWGLAAPQSMEQHWERDRGGTALQHSALRSTPHGPGDKAPVSKHKLPGQQDAHAPRPLHHDRKARPRQTQAHLESQPAR